MDSPLEMFGQRYSASKMHLHGGLDLPVGLSLRASKMDTNIFDRHVRMHAALGSA
jgi:hypothetical protein